MTDDLIAFLRARLDETERIARAGEVSDWSIDRQYHDGGESYWDVDGPGGGWIAHVGDFHDAEHIAANDPARVLRQVQAHRAILDDCEERRSVQALLPLKALASIWSDHPDFRQEWR